MEALEEMSGQCAVERSIGVITQEICLYKEQAGVAILRIGKCLMEAKQQLSHGEWGDWLEREVEFSERTAQDLMRIAREYKNPQLLADLGNSTSKAIALLSLPAEEREGFVKESHEVNGEEKTVDEMSTRELKKLMKELDEEREKNATLQLSLVQAQEEIQEKEAINAEEAEERAREAEAEKERLEAELEALRAGGVEPSKDVMEQIRQETEKAVLEKQEKVIQKKIEKLTKEAEKAKKEAEEAKKELELKAKAVATAEMVADKVKDEKEALKREMEKKLAMASSKVEVFKVHFEGTKEQINKMIACLEELGVEEAEKLKGAIVALCESAIEMTKGV